MEAQGVLAGARRPGWQGPTPSHHVHHERDRHVDFAQGPQTAVLVFARPWALELYFLHIEEMAVLHDHKEITHRTDGH